MERCTVSVIIPVYNEERYIKRCLTSIVKQSQSLQEIIVVDDGSSDNSILQFKIKNFKLLQQAHQGPATARNLGAQVTSAEILVFLDADMEYDKNFVRELVKPIFDGRAIATFTRSEFVGNLSNRWARYWDQSTGNQSGKRVINPSEKGKAFRAITAAAFARSGGFDNFGYGDDVSVLEKLNMHSLAVDSARAWHFNPETLTEVYCSARWMGRDPKHQGNLIKLLVFSPPAAIVKALLGSLRNGLAFGLFKLIFDTGHFMGMVDANFGKVHSK